MKIVGLEVLGDQTFGDNGFLVLHRTRLQNLRADGSRSATYVSDWVERPRARDAVVVVIYHQTAGQTRVLIREGLRVPLFLGRPDAPQLYCAEVVAGLIEKEDIGDAGIRERAAIEVHEEAGFTVKPAAIESLGAASFPTPGCLPEAFHLMAVKIDDPNAAGNPPGDGSPFEEGAVIRWVPLDEAIAECVSGKINDSKSELALRRLRDRLA